MPDDNLTPIEEEEPLSPELPAPECDQVMSAEVSQALQITDVKCLKICEHIFWL